MVLVPIDLFRPAGLQSAVVVARGSRCNQTHAGPTMKRTRWMFEWDQPQDSVKCDAEVLIRLKVLPAVPGLKDWSFLCGCTMLAKTRSHAHSHTKQNLKIQDVSSKQELLDTELTCGSPVGKYEWRTPGGRSGRPVEARQVS